MLINSQCNAVRRRDKWLTISHLACGAASCLS
jgi:hypothetical protein